MALDAARVAPELPRGTEVAGLVTALVELGLADHRGVVPQINGTSPPPGLQWPLEAASERWTGTIAVGGTPQALRVELTLCRTEVDCLTHASEAGTSDNPARSVSEVLSLAMAQMKGEPAPAYPMSGWELPESKDTYAVLIAGRSAATFYGLREPTAPGLRWDRRADPISRAIHIDPRMPAAGWIGGRVAYADGDFLKAAALLERASISRPTSALMLADRAACLSAEGKATDAWDAWKRVEQAAPGDVRFAVPIARAALAADLPIEARKRLSALPQRVDRDPAVAEMRVEAADAIEPDGASDALLAAWQDAALLNPEPVRRRMHLRVQTSDYEGALEMVAALSDRGADVERQQAELSLLAALHRWDEAAARADRLGMADLAGRIRARGALELDPQALPDQLANQDDSDSLVALARAHLARSEHAEALAQADKALKKRADLPTALEIRSVALTGLDREKDAEKARARLKLVDPRWDDLHRSYGATGPSTAPDATGPGSQAQPASP